MDRKWFNNDFETCTNGDCPYCADFCPVAENQEVCRYSGLDDTEIALRECLDAEKEDSREAIQVLAEENRTLKKLYENGKSAIDTNQRLSQKNCELENQLHDSYQGHLLDVVIPGLEKQLAAYEDILGDDYDLNRLRDLAQADREGRCVVLPCKVGDKYYTLGRYCTEGGYFLEPTIHSVSDCEYCAEKCDRELRVTEGTFWSVQPILILKDEIGKTVFLTREEAEKALKERENNE